jgi:hypothetical protein
MAVDSIASQHCIGHRLPYDCQAEFNQVTADLLRRDHSGAYLVSSFLGVASEDKKNWAYDLIASGRLVPAPALILSIFRSFLDRVHATFFFITIFHSRKI